MGQRCLLAHLAKPCECPKIIGDTLWWRREFWGVYEAGQMGPPKGGFLVCLIFFGFFYYGQLTLHYFGFYVFHNLGVLF
jgi:hypothetical protein